MVKRLGTLSILALAAFAGGWTAVAVSPRLAVPAFAQGQPPPLPPAAAEPLSERFEAVARKLGPTVVAIDAKQPATAGARGRTVEKEKSGSGVLFRYPGKPGTLVLTNNHVVASTSPDQITVSLADGRVMRPTSLWPDPESDIAVLRLEAEDLPAAAFGDSDRARVGNWVVAIGSPFGLNQSVTHGIISARERGQVSLGSTIRIKDFLQTDAAINPGSSGGPLANLDGEVIGINTAIASESGNNSGVAFSIPINLVQRVVKQLLERGSVARGYLGLQMATAMEPADALGLGLDRATGALVDRVFEGTPAAQAGLRERDVILSVNNVPVRTENQFINLIAALPAGERVRLEVWRDRRKQTLEAVVGDWTQVQSRFRAAPPAER
jgi:S1-C subfamily serine protease